MGQSMETPTLAEFLRARLAEDEEKAKQVEPDQSPTELRAMVARDGGQPFLVIDAARLLREVRTKRWIVDEYEKEAWVLKQGHRTGWTEGGQAARESMLRILAAVYFDHPDYRREWEPARQSRVGG